MTGNDKILETVVDLLREGRPLELAVFLVRSLELLSEEETQYLSYNSLSNLAKTRIDDPALLRAISALCNQRANVLRPFFVYHDEKSGEERPLSSSEYSKYKSLDPHYNPITGEKDLDFYNHISPYFRTSDTFSHVGEEP